MAAPVHHDGRSQLPTEQGDLTDPALLRLQLRRLSALVDELVVRQADHGARLAVAKATIARLERWGRVRDLAALALLGPVLLWAGLVTLAWVLG